jgi:hypothetical protein
MKPKKQKLTLGKSTIANLNDLELANAHGGTRYTPDPPTTTQAAECQSFWVTDCKDCWIETDYTILEPCPTNGTPSC